ncbi:MAG: OsmC family protein [Planctomycetota bacterium]|jgi:uncharacterized OsmC-like protein
MPGQQVAKSLNGVDVKRLMETIDEVRQNPDLAKFSFRAANRWLGADHNQSTIKDFYGAGNEDTSRSKPYVFDAGEPQVLVGSDSGANPVEFVLHALAACLTTTMVYHAASRGIEIESVESKVEGDIDIQGFLGLKKDIRKGYQRIGVTFRVKSNASPEQLAELAKFSPVFDTISNPVDVQVKVDKT